MRQAVMVSPGKIEFRDVPVPRPGDDQVLVKIHRIGICGSDIHVYHGKHPYTSYPVVQGHEAAGEITEKGARVRGLAIGDRVTIRPQVTCGACYPCTHGQYHICDQLKVMGFQTTGVASDFVAVKASNILKLPRGTPFDFGAMVEPLAVGVHALSRGGSAKGKKVLVLGAGPIGNLVAQAAHGMGAADVAITDVSEFRLGVAAKCGIEHRLNASSSGMEAFIPGVFGKDKADLILECVGANPTVAQAVSSARKGTDIIIVGVFGDKATVDLGLVQDRELRLIGTLMYQESDFRTAIGLIEKGRVSLEPLITHHFPFSDYEAAYRHIETNRETSMKVMMDIQE
jgi:L-iditol 2-dehydrogenase